MPENNNVLKSSEVNARLSELISSMSETDKRKLLKELVKRSQSGFFEKRKHSRKTSRIAVDFSIDGLPFTHFIQNISKSGAFIETELPFLNNKQISMSFTLPVDGDPIKTSGKIVRTDSKGIGVQFGESIPVI